VRANRDHRRNDGEGFATDVDESDSLVVAGDFKFGSGEDMRSFEKGVIAAEAGSHRALQG